MGRLPCCDKVGVKKGPWTPEEDIILVSYVQQHGAANWRSVPTNTGLKRCSKSCRLRWTNYLRPGIKRGVFTRDEEKIIIQLQSLFGNKWAAIASYLPERTDNDIKNYWNTHLKKKLLKTDQNSPCNVKPADGSHSISRGQWEQKLQTDIDMAKQALSDALSLHKPTSSPHIQTHTYISSTENIARLLKNWNQSTSNDKNRAFKSNSSSTQHSFTYQVSESDSKKLGVDLSETFESLFGFESFDSNSEFSQSNLSPQGSLFQGESKPDLSGQVPMSMFENWVIDQQGVVEEKPDLSSFSFYENADLF